MTRTIGGHLSRALSAWHDVAALENEAECAGTRARAVRFDLLAAGAEGAAYGHLFRAAELAYDLGTRSALHKRTRRS